MQKISRNHLISLNRITNHDMERIISRGVEFSNSPDCYRDILKGKVIGIYFTKTSTRTRTAFSAAALRMGASIIAYGPSDLQTGTGESMEDTANVFSGMLDGLVMRTAEPYVEMDIFASQNRMSVVNAMSSEEHPTQALSDMTTIMKTRGSLSSLKFMYIGEGNNTATGLALGLSRFPNATLYFYTPYGYGLPEEALQAAKINGQRSNSTILERHNLKEIPGSLDYIYTTRWQTTGTTKPDPGWRDIFKPFKVSQQLIDSFDKCTFMHDLPAHRGEEVDASVLDGPQSIAFLQAEMKMYSAMAVLEWAVNGYHSTASRPDNQHHRRSYVHAS